MTKQFLITSDQYISVEELEAKHFFIEKLISLRLIGKDTTTSIIYDEDLKMHLLNKRVDPDVSLTPFRFNTPKTNYILDSSNSFTLW